MKARNLLGIFLVSSLIINCQSDRSLSQKIDQVLRFYYQDASGRDLLMPSDSTGYAGNMQLFDLNDIRLNTPIEGINFPMDSAENKHYLEYIAGATRVLQDSSSPSDKTYYSDILITMKKGLQGAVADSDTVHIVYTWSPTLFQVSAVTYNRNLVFTNTADSLNKIIITKK